MEPYYESKNLKYQDWQEKELPIYRKWFADPINIEFMRYPRELCDQIIYNIEKIIGKTKPPQHHFSIYTKKDDELIGFCDICKKYLFDVAELGIFIGEHNHWRKGFGSEIVDFLLDFGFNKLGVHVIELFTHELNVASTSLFRKKGFIHEYVQKEYLKTEKSYQNMLYMYLINKEWIGNKN